MIADTIDTTGQAPYEQCGYCHEYDGNSKMPMYPRLAGQQAAYIVKQLQDFRAGRRLGQMQATAELLSDEDIQIVANYFSQQSMQVDTTPPLSEAQKQLAAKLYFDGDPKRDLAACASCHGENGQGGASIPRLAGQHAPYLYDQLLAFQTGSRSNDAQGQMQDITRQLSVLELQVMVKFLSRLSAPSRAEKQTRRAGEQCIKKPLKTTSNDPSAGVFGASCHKGKNHVDAADLTHIITCYNKLY